MNRHLHHLVAAMVALHIAATDAAAAPVAELRLRAEVRLFRPVVRLGDVAEIVVSDDARAQQLAETILLPAPAPGTQQFLTAQELRNLLVGLGESHATIRVHGPGNVAIVSVAGTAADRALYEQAGRPGRHASVRPASHAQSASASSEKAQPRQIRETMERAIRQYLADRTGQPSDWQIEFDIPERYTRSIQSARSDLVCRGGSPPWTGRQRFVLSYLGAEGEVHLPVFAEITPPQSIVVAARPIARGAMITAADLEVRQGAARASISSGRRTAFETVEELVGRVASRAIPAGNVIYSDQAHPPVLVKRGELITVGTQGGGIRVRATARARQEGVMGDLIEVESLETKERYEARVVGPGEVAVLVTASREVARTPARGARSLRR